MNKIMFKKLATKILVISIIMTTVSYLYFSVPLAVFPDSLGYYAFMGIFKGTATLSTWDVMRGPVFPALIYIFLSLFGGAMTGILIGAYIFFVGLIIMFYVALNKIMRILALGRLRVVIAVLLFIVLVVFNPILFGYSHALLTEAVVPFFALSSCLLSWAWIKVSFFKHKIIYILYLLLFVFMFLFMWFIKQPYFTIALFPLVLSSLISVIVDRSLRNFLQRFATVAICVACLVLAIFSWRSFLVANGVDQKRTSSVDGHFLSSQIIGGISNGEITKEPITSTDQISKDRFISETNKKMAISAIDNSGAENRGSVRLFTVKSLAGIDIDKIMMISKEKDYTVRDALSVWSTVLVSHPIVMLDSYLSNYLVVADIYDYNNNLYTNKLTLVKRLGSYGHENTSIGLRYLNNPANMDSWMLKSPYSSGLKYIEKNSDSIANVVYGATWPFYQVMYTIFILSLPFALIGSIIRYIRLLRNRAEKQAKRNIYELLIIVFGFGFFHVIFNAVLGAMLDRYSFVVFPAVTLGYIILFVLNTKLAATINNFFQKLKNLRRG